MGFFKNVKSDIKIFPANSVNALYSVDYRNEIRYQPEDVITFSNEFVCNAINKYYEYDIENNNSKCVDLISSLRNIVSNLGDYVVDKKDPAITPPVILPVICKEYKDEDWVVIGGASFRCRQCAFVGDADHTGLHWSAICNKMNCKGLVFKKLDYDVN